MAKIIIAGDSMVVVSSYALEALKKVEKYRPKMLCLYEEDGKTVCFKVGTTSGEGSISAYGASFGSATHDEDRLATITTGIPAGTADAIQFAQEKVGVAIINLNKVESNIDAAIADIDAEIAEVRENITVV